MVKARRNEHFEQLYNPPSTADCTILDELEVLDQNHIEDAVPFLRNKVENAIKRMKTGKALKIDNIAVEEIKATEEERVSIYFKLFEEIWKQEHVPEYWQRTVTVPIFKKKDNTVCDNYRRISLPCHNEKIFALVLLQTIRTRMEEILTEVQTGFRRGRSTIDQLYTLTL